MSDIVLVTQPEFAKAEEAFRGETRVCVEAAPPEESLLSQAVSDRACRAVIVGVDAYRGPLYQALAANGGQRGAIIARFGIGHDGVDKRQARDHRITVTNTPGVLDTSVAEHTMWLIGALARHVATSHLAMSAGEFKSRIGRQLHGQTLGVLGFGPIGRRVAAIAHFGFGMRVLAVGRLSAKELAGREKMSIEKIYKNLGLDAYTNDVERALRDSDVLSVHLPAAESTRQFVNAERLALMKPDALIVNTARGSVLDENALYDALAAKRLGGAALDVFENEPYRPQSPERDLRELPNVVLTPHIGSNTRQANEAMARAALENVHNFLCGNMAGLTEVT